MTRTRALSAALLAALALGAWWLAPHDRQRENADAPMVQRAADALETRPRADDARALSSARAPRDAFLTPDLRHKLDALWLEAGNATTPVELKQRLAAALARQVGPEQLLRATQLLDRYVDYRVALGGLKAMADLNDPRALRDALAARQQLRHELFTDDEYDALFAREEALDQFTVTRLEILRDPGLTAEQKQSRLRVAERALGDDELAARAALLQHETVAAQTAALDATGASEAQRYAQRSATFGEAAAQRLAQLDAEERDWQGRLAQYAQAKTAQYPPQQLQTLKEQLFSPQEQLRIEAALALRTRSRR